MTLQRVNQNYRKISLFDYINIIFMLFVAFATLYPFYYCFVISFNDGIDALIPGIYFWPRKFTLENYRFVFSTKLLLTAFRNSVLRTVIGTILHVIITSAAAYALSKRDLFGRKAYMILFIITMYFSGGLIPTYLVFKKIGLTDNFLVYLLPLAWSYFNALLFMAYYDSIPDSLEESALIDGANQIYIFIRIIFPVSMPIIATIALFIGVNQWNSWMDTMIYTSNPQLETLQNLLIKIIKEAEYMIKIMQEAMQKGGGGSVGSMPVTPFTIRVATMIVTTFPIVIAYPFLQKYFIKGIMLGAVKA